MLDLRTAKKIMETVNKGDGVHYGDIITLTEARRMKMVEVSETGGYSIVSMQKGDMTILVRVLVKDNHIDCKVKFVCW